MITASAVFRRLAAEHRRVGATELAVSVDADADASVRLDAADEPRMVRQALFLEIGAAMQRVRDARLHKDTREEQLQQAILDTARRELVEVGTPVARADSAGTRQFREDGDNSEVTPTGWERANARQALRWRTDLDDTTRDQLVEADALHAARLRAEREQSIAGRAVSPLATRTDVGKADAARDELGRAADLVENAAKLFTAAGDDTDATRIKALLTELRSLALSPDKRADVVDVPRWRKPLPSRIRVDEENRADEKGDE